MMDDRTHTGAGMLAWDKNQFIFHFVSKQNGLVTFLLHRSTFNALTRTKKKKKERALICMFDILLFVNRSTLVSF